MKLEDILQLARILGLKTHGKGRGKNILLQCPTAPYSGEHAHAEDVAPSWSVMIDDTGYSVCNCFGCGRRGTLIGFLARAQKEFGVFEEALEFARRVEVFDLRANFKRAIDGSGRKRPHTFTHLNFIRATQTHIPAYVLKRGITKQEVGQWMIGLDLYEHRATFPIWDREGNVVGVIGRTVFEDVEPKYKVYYDFSSKHYFHGEHKLDFTFDEAVLVEGPIDSVITSRYTKNVLGLLGLRSMSDIKRDKLKRWFDTVTFLLDADAAGDFATVQLGLWLAPVMRIYVAFLPPGRDPANAPHDIGTALKNRVLWDRLGLDNRKVIA